VVREEGGDRATPSGGKRLRVSPGDPAREEEAAEGCVRRVVLCGVGQAPLRESTPVTGGYCPAGSSYHRPARSRGSGERASKTFAEIITVSRAILADSARSCRRRSQRSWTLNAATIAGFNEGSRERTSTGR